VYTKRGVVRAEEEAGTLTRSQFSSTRALLSTV